MFAEQGYDETTVAEIAEAAGLTKRTFFRYFSDKREVLFNGSRELQDRWIGGIEAAPGRRASRWPRCVPGSMRWELFAGRHPFARMRSQIITANPELQERELIKLQSLASAIETALADRGVSVNAAILASRRA